MRPNRYEPGRAHIIVYNWDNRASVPVNVASVLPVGVTYEVYNAQDLSAPPVLSGVFTGAPLQLPMTGLTVAAPNGPLLRPPPTGPTFNVFILIPCQARLAISHVANAVELSWPTNCGPYGLQFRASASAAGNWTDVQTQPTIRADRYVVSRPITATTGFYRLRSR